MHSLLRKYHQLRELPKSLREQDHARTRLLTWTLLVECLAVAGIASLLLLPQLGDLQFFRHTEADRTLISWEMLESGTLLVPHLLESPILTKPPLFYWMQVLTFKLMGEVNEFSARLPSTLAAVISAVFLWIFLRKLHFSRRFSLLSSGILLSSSQFFILARSAEIDMLYGVCSWIALALPFLGVSVEPARRADEGIATRSTGSYLPLLFSAYLFLALAFLTKGPPTLAFFFLAILGFRWWLLAKPIVDRRWLLQHLSASLGFIIPVVIWLWALGSEVGWQALLREFHHEILARAWEPSERNRGILFYPLALFLTTLPWSGVAISYMAFSARRSGNLLRGLSGISRVQQLFLSYSLMLVLIAVALLSLSEGKSMRYLFPVHMFVCVLIARVIAEAFERLTPVKFSGIFIMKVSALFLLWSIFAFCSASDFYLALSGVRNAFPLSDWFPTVLFVGTALSVVVVLLLLGCSRESWRLLALAGVVLIATARVVVLDLYIEQRNASRSVVPIAQRLSSLIPESKSVYVLEMFERWNLYYLKQEGIHSLRVSPKVASSFSHSEERVLLLLNESEESWRVAELRHFDPGTKIIERLEDPKEPLLLVETAARSLQHLELQSRFPTEPTKPRLTESFSPVKPEV